MKQMKRLVNEYETYTEKGNSLADYAKKLFSPIMDHFIDEGYSTIDIQHILLEEISIMICEKRLARNVTWRKSQKQPNKGK